MVSLEMCSIMLLLLLCGNVSVSIIIFMFPHIKPIPNSYKCVNYLCVMTRGWRAVKTLLHKEQRYVTAVNPSAFGREDLLPIFPVAVRCGERGAKRLQPPSGLADSRGQRSHLCSALCSPDCIAHSLTLYFVIK